MKVRVMGSADQVQRLAALLAGHGLGTGRIYPLRRSGGQRTYLDLDDRTVERLLRRLEALDDPLSTLWTALQDGD